MRFVWVGIAGALGSLARYGVGLALDHQRFPFATMVVNLTGAFGLGLFLTLALGRLPVSVMTPVAVGIFGGYTTFSTFAWDGFTLSRNERVLTAFVYVSVSVVGGLLAAWLGYVAGRALR
jgi:CrcB protein